MDKKRRYCRWTVSVVLMIMCCLPAIRVTAQQLPVYSQYSFNAFLLNPAAAGAEGYTAINTTTRQQWVGVEGAPVTYCLSMQSRIKKKTILTGASAKKRYGSNQTGRVGIGGYVYKDRIGLMDQTGAEFTYAYHIAGSTSQLSFGATFSFFQFKLNDQGIRLAAPKDNLIDNEPMVMYIPDANVGVYYTNPRLFFGVSIFHLSSASVMFGPYKDKKYRLLRQYNTTAGFNIPLSGTLSIEPSCYLKISEEWRLQGDAVAKLIYDRKLWMGIGYRNPGMIIGSVGFKISRFYLGYAYDHSSNPLTTYSSGTHELMMAYKFGDNLRRYRWMERY